MDKPAPVQKAELSIYSPAAVQNIDPALMYVDLLDSSDLNTRRTKCHPENQTKYHC